MMINAQMSSPYAGTYGQPTPGGGMTPKMQMMNMIHSIRTVARGNSSENNKNDLNLLFLFFNSSFNTCQRYCNRH